MSSGGMILPADLAGAITDNAQESEHEKRRVMESDNLIPRIFEVRPIEQMSHGLYHVSNVRVTDSKLIEREMGGDLTVGNEGEKRFVVAKRRYFERSFILPDELIEHAMMGAGRARDGIEAWAAEHGAIMAEGRMQAEQSHAARFFNEGGYTTAPADSVFNNTINGIIADSGGGLMFDGVELFNLTGNARTALSGSTYYNHGGALSLTATNLKTMLNLVQDTNGYSELGERFDNRCDTLLCGLDVQHEAEQILRTDRLAGTGNNDGNPFGSIRDGLVVWPYLTDAGGWYVGKARKGLIWFQGGPIDVKFERRGRNVSVSFQAEWGACADEWRHWGAANTSAS